MDYIETKRGNKGDDTIANFANFIAGDSADKDNIKTQFDSADASFYFKFFDDNVTQSDITTRIWAVTTSDEPVWDRDNQLWDATGSDAKDNWGDGDFTGSQVLQRVVSPNNTFNEYFLDQAFMSTKSDDVTWDNDGELIFS